MPIAITPAGRFRSTTGRAGERFILRRDTALQRTEADQLEAARIHLFDALHPPEAPDAH